jgi:methionyl aminopeptidase
MIVLKTPAELALMRAAGLIVAEVLSQLKSMVKPGITLAALDKRAEEIIRSHGATPSFKGYQPEGAPYPFPASICASVNDELVHGIPGPRKLKEGDVLKIDCGAVYKGYHGDSAVTVGVGRVSAQAQKLIETVEACFWAGAAQCRAGNRAGDVGAAIQSVAEAAGFSVVRQYTSHGVGRDLHEGFSMQNFGQPGTGMLLRPGLTIALEPMINAGHWDTKVLKDGWTVSTIDGKLAAQFEHTVAVTQSDPDILTLPG